MINITQSIKALEPDFLDKANRSGYVCPVCGNGTGRDGDGLKPYGKNYHYHCFKCGFGGDIIDLFGAAYGIENPGEKIRAFAKHYGIEDDRPQSGSRKPEQKPERKASRRHEAERKPGTAVSVDRSSYFKACQMNNDGSYLDSRGISLATQRRFGVGFDPAWRNPKAIETLKAKGKKPESIPGMPAVIIPRDGGSYLARDTRPEEEISADRRRYMKQIVGGASLFNGEALKDAGPVFIVEGEIDALSVIEAGGTAVALCSAANTRLLIDWYLDHPGCCPGCIIMFDNDDAGRRAKDRITADLHDIGILCGVVVYPDKYKDPNDFWTADPNGMRALILMETLAFKNVNGNDRFIV